MRHMIGGGPFCLEVGQLKIVEIFSGRLKEILGPDLVHIKAERGDPQRKFNCFADREGCTCYIISGGPYSFNLVNSQSVKDPLKAFEKSLGQVGFEFKLK